MSEVTWYVFTFLGGFGMSYLMDGFDRKLAIPMVWWCASRIIYEATR